MNDRELRDLSSAIDAIDAWAENAPRSELAAIVRLLCFALQKFAQENGELWHSSKELNDEALNLATRITSAVGEDCHSREAEFGVARSAMAGASASRGPAP